MGVSFLLGLYLVSGVLGNVLPRQDNKTCNAVDGCSPEITHLWGQYSPYFSLAAESKNIEDDTPSECQVTFVQVLSRHGARYPTSSKGKKYAGLVAGIQRNAKSLTGKYAFLNDWNYTLGQDDLTPFGENQLVESGRKFYHRYEQLARNTVPFIRASGSDRVIASGEKFIEGLQGMKKNDARARADQDIEIDVVIEEGDGFNNTLDHGRCTKFENSELGDYVAGNYTQTFAPAIRERLEKDLPGVSLSNDDVLYLMDMCSFETVAKTPDASELSPFCDLFTHEEWRKYNYVQSLKKYYGYGAGNPLGPTQGVGFANELIARLTHSPVRDQTSTNHTLDSNPATFPLNATIYADFSHDNGMIPIFFALGLYNGTKPLSQSTVETAKQANGYSAAWVVPFAARAYIEMMQCSGEKEPFVRALVNDRIVPLHGCTVDEYGRCRRDDFIRGLSFARSGGDWGSCFA
ncbi:hypothetical protein MW887_010686 [Aspergillus wentii]|nr:hypothetical protein MW887_010686 [Aspergillus wentii]